MLHIFTVCRGFLLAVVGVCGPSRASTAWRAFLPPGVGCCRLSWSLVGASAVKGARPVSVAGCCRLSWAPVVWRGFLLSDLRTRCLSRAAVACRGLVPSVVGPGGPAWASAVCGEVLSHVDTSKSQKHITIHSSHRSVQV